MNSFEDGKMLLIDKPYEWTSFDVVNKIRNFLKIKKVGHAGTLDPLATGLLIICTGKFTKKINEYMAKEKEYIGTFFLGATTPTFDLESEPENIKPIDDISAESILQNTQQFIGEIMQYPPIHSAVKVNGKRLYELARKGKEVNPEPRKVFIKTFTIEKIELPLVYFKVTCGTGTYIRSLANDFGEVLGCGAYLHSLCRTKIGEHSLDDAMTIEQVTSNQNING